jgi:DNA primase
MDHVADLLKEKGVYFTYSGQDLLIKCLNPDHNDSNPSERIDKVTGAFHCFSCGHKGNIFRHFGVLTGNQVHIKVAKLKEKIKNLQISTTGLEMPEFFHPYSHSFRGISSKTLKEFGAFYLSQDDKYMKGFEDRIIFPIKDITDKIVMFLGRHTLSDGNPRYLNYPHGVSAPLYPVKQIPHTRSIVLVEGIFDLLNCYDKGLHNAVCTFGINTLQKDTHIKLLQYKIQGITKIYVMFDGDGPGREAAKKLKPLIEQEEFEVEIIPLEDGTDPGGMSEEYIHSIKEYVNA